jgi:hypothetical protein
MVIYRTLRIKVTYPIIGKRKVNLRLNLNKFVL